MVSRQVGTCHIYVGSLMSYALRFKGLTLAKKHLTRNVRQIYDLTGALFVRLDSIGMLVLKIIGHVFKIYVAFFPLQRSLHCCSGTWPWLRQRTEACLRESPQVPSTFCCRVQRQWRPSISPQNILTINFSFSCC